jgi:Na+/proline symporter
MVAFGMIGASISGITFVSVPGMVLNTQMTYLQMCMGFILGYVVVAFALLPLYYRLNLTSIYAYLGQRLGRRSHKTGSWLFLLSKMTGAAVRFYVVCIILQRFVFEPQGVPFAVTTVILVLLIWLYTRTGGIKTLVWTDSLQTLCLFAALLLIIYKVATDLGLSMESVAGVVDSHQLSRVFVWDDWASKQNFWKQFLSGIFVVLVMTGVDQDMMQKNLTCKTLRGAQKDMCTYGVAFLPANLLFLSLGVLLTMWYQQHGLALPASGDDLLPHFIQTTSTLTANGQLLTALFVLGIVAASFSSADSALTSLTTIYCVDIMERKDDERLRKRTHIAVCAVFVLFILLFKTVNSTSLIDAIYIICGYTYGPLLGLFAYGLLVHKKTNDRYVPYVAVVSPLICFVLDRYVSPMFGYQFGYELLMLNGLITFAGIALLQVLPCNRSLQP